MENIFYFFMYMLIDLYKEIYRKEIKFFMEIYYIFVFILKYFGYFK